MSNFVDRYRTPIVVALIAIAAVAAAVLVLQRIDDDPRSLVVEPGVEVPSDIRVYVAGAVNEPGVYPMSSEARWIDAVEAAGGPTGDADLEAINLSQRVEDEAQIIVPRFDEVALVVGNQSAPSGLINLNTADSAALESLPGIGEIRAERIILSRDADGLFVQVEDLLLRDLVPDSVYQEIAPLVTVN